MLVELVAQGLLLGGLLDRGRRGRGSRIRLRGKRRVDQLARGIDVDGLRHADGHHRLAREALGLDVLVRCDHDGARAGDLGRRQRVLDADLAMGLDLDGEAALGRSLLERLLRHEGVGDACGAARGSNDIVRFCHDPSLYSCAPIGALLRPLWGVC